MDIKTKRSNREISDDIWNNCPCTIDNSDEFYDAAMQFHKAMNQQNSLIVAELKDLLTQNALGEISFSRLVEIINQKFNGNNK